MEIEELEKILAEEEERYYPWAMAALKQANPNPNKEERKRIEEEMAILHKVKHSKILYVMKTLVDRIRNDGETYLLGTDITSIYVVYVLGLTKFNPFDSKAKPEPYFGNSDNPRKELRFVIHVRPEYQSTVIDYLKEYEDDANIYIARLFRDRVPHSDSFAFFPKKLDVRKGGFPFGFGQEEEYPVLFSDVGEITMGFKICVSARLRLGLLSHVMKDQGIGFEEGRAEYMQVLKDKRFSTPLERRYLGLMREPLSMPLAYYVPFFAMMCDVHRIPEEEKENQAMSKMLLNGHVRFHTRDTFYYLLGIRGASFAEAQEACRTVCGGKFLKDYQAGKYGFTLTEDDITELKTIDFIISRGSAAEELWLRIQEAHCFLQDPDAYLFWDGIYAKEIVPNKA